jgi:hypothetical protein
MKQGVFDHVEGVEQQQEKGNIAEFFLLRKKGAKIDGDVRSANRIASFIVEGQSYDELKQKARNALSSIEIRDEQGNPLLNREIYSSL